MRDYERLVLGFDVSCIYRAFRGGGGSPTGARRSKIKPDRPCMHGNNYRAGRSKTEHACMHSLKSELLSK